MTRSNRVSAASFPLLALILALAPLARAAEPTGRDFVPVQAGFRPQAGPVPTFAPGRVLIKLAPTALKAAAFAAPADKGGTVAGARTGLASLDALLDGSGASRLERALVNVANKAAGTDAGVERWYLASVARETDLPALARALAADPNVEAVELDWYAFPAVVPDDPDQPSNWGHNNTAQLPDFGWGTTWSHTGPGVGTVGFDANAHVAWGGTQGFGSTTTIIAIIDTGVDTAHPDLQLVPGYDYGSNDSNPHDEGAGAGHGTCCAGVAAAIADNGLGTAGVAGDCRIMPLKIADAAGSLTLTAAANALYFAADNGADIASMSFGAAISSNAIMDAAITYAANAGVVMFAATGNENKSTISYPAVNANVIGVGAASPCGDRKRSSSSSAEVNPGVTVDPNGYTCDGERWWGSSYGRTTQDHAGAVDLIAPTILPTTDISGSAGYQAGDYEPFFNGTSCATPYAAGVAALVRAQNPAWTPAQVRARLTSTAIDIVNVESAAGWDRYAGYGMVDAQAAVGATAALPPVAAFTHGAVDGCVPLGVTFTDASTGEITDWAWDFGDGGTSTLEDPAHAYAAAGTYTVSLAVTGPGGSDTVTAVDLVTVGAAPAAAFSASDTTGTAPLSVTFTDLSTGAASWNWDFGGDGTDTAQHPSHTFLAPGLYPVQLVVTGACGADTTLLVVEVTAPGAPVAAFSREPLRGCAPLSVAFADQSTGLLTGRAWDFGDATTDTAAAPTHLYTAPGSYDVRLVVFGPGGADTLAVVGAVIVDAPVAAAFTTDATTGAAPLTISFTDNSTGGAVAWLWEFGDGQSDTAQNPVHVYAGEGSYDVSLTVTGPCGVDVELMPALVVVSGLSGIGDVVNARFGLAQNYPNPFNPLTTISFSLGAAGPVRLEIFDATGRRVDVLVDESRDAGAHTVRWQPADHASGVYFARLTAEGRTATTRMVLLK